MSYCRWSTNSFGCDLYCYDDVAGGHTIHVASSRRVSVPTVELKVGADNKPTNLTEYMDEISRCVEKIGLPYDGTTLRCATREEFLDTLKELRRVGYRFPDTVIEAVQAEIDSGEPENDGVAE
jgi:hypothetical protein